MKTVNYLIVSLDKAYNNEAQISTGDSVIINSTIESADYVNRVATVVAAPDFTILQEGDKVIVHHNIFRLRNDVNGNVAPSNYFMEDNKYIVPLTEVFMYDRGEGWIPITPFCFVEPITKEQKQGFDLSLAESTYKGRLERLGIMKYPNEELLTQGVKKGDKIMFSEDSEYEFVIDDVLYYKMSTKDILMKL